MHKPGHKSGQKGDNMVKNNKINAKQLADNIRYYMRVQDITNKDVATAFGITPQAWYAKRAKPNRYSIDDINVLLKLFRVDYKELIDRGI